MKKIVEFAFVFSLLFSSACFSQPGQWVWIHGSNVSQSAGNFGMQGVSAPTNDPPATYESCEWRDLNGNFWAFGGLNSNYQCYGDLWKYDPTINEWVWKKGNGSLGDPGNYGTMGVASSSNNPPSRAWGMATWVDLQGNFWMFGGSGAFVFGDLWKYNPSTNEWTWMKGPSGNGGPGVYGTIGVPDPANNPAGRYEVATSWTDNAGDLWLFGGYSGNVYNDLWRFNIATNEWTWMNGSSFPGAPAVYGTQGIEAPANTPGARMSYTHWKDSNGKLWFFGGFDYINGIELNEMWRLNPLTGNWAWISGGTNLNGLFNTQCIADSSNIPRARMESRAAITDQNGNFWLFGGGQGNTFQNIFNDLWKYCVATNEWTWMSGDSIANPNGNWGTMGVSSPLNKPNGRGGNLMWSDQNGSLYIFGGTDQNWANPYNDLWKFEIDPACGSCNALPQAIFTAPNQICPGTCTSFNNLSVNATSFYWTFAGANPSTSIDVNPTNICYNSPGNYSVTLIATNANGSDTISLNNYITVYPYPPPQGISQNGDTLFANPGAVSYQWYHGGNIIFGATNYFYVATESGDFNVVATDANGCQVEAAIFDVVAGISSVSSSVPELNIFPDPVKSSLMIDSHHKQINSITIFNTLGENVMSLNRIISNKSSEYIVDVSSLSSGFYFLLTSMSTGDVMNHFIKK